MKVERRKKMTPDERKELIIKLYYEEHKRPVDIAPKVGTSQQYVSQIAKLDERYAQEKAYKDKVSNKKSKEKKKEYDHEYWKTYVRKSKQENDKESYDALIRQINSDNEKLSTKTEMSDLKFVECNRSAYDYAKTSSRLVLKTEINATFDVPQIIQNIVHASSISNKKVYV